MTSRLAYEMLAPLLQQVAPADRCVRVLRRSDEGQAAAFKSFIDYLVQRKRAGVVNLPEGGGGKRTLYLVPPVPQALEQLQLRAVPGDVLYALVVLSSGR